MHLTVFFKKYILLSVFIYVTVDPSLSKDDEIFRHPEPDIYIKLTLHAMIFVYNIINCKRLLKLINVKPGNYLKDKELTISKIVNENVSILRKKTIVEYCSSIPCLSLTNFNMHAFSAIQMNIKFKSRFND